MDDLDLEPQRTAGTPQLSRVLALVLGLVVASGCASGRLLAEPRSPGAGGDASAHLFVLRQSQITGAAVTVPVEIDGTQVAELGTGDYLQFEVEPGPHVVSVGFQGREESQRVVASAGGRYFFEFHFDMTSMEGIDFLRPLDAAQGERAIASGKYTKLTE